MKKLELTTRSIEVFYNIVSRATINRANNESSLVYEYSCCIIYIYCTLLPGYTRKHANS